MSDRAISKVIENYCESFRPGNASAILPFCHCPLTVFTHNTFMSLSEPCEIEAQFSDILSSLIDQQFSHSTINNMHTHNLNKNTALVTAEFTRIKNDASILEEISATYTLHRNQEGDWKIAVIIVHDTE
ncbi:MAG: hypothetical protein V7785_11385 [Bermanella sp.]